VVVVDTAWTGRVEHAPSHSWNLHHLSTHPRGGQTQLRPHTHVRQPSVDLNRAFFCFFLFFFFQAEDGIRDFHVTGVQTCALPIFQGLPLDVGRERRRQLLVVPAGVVDAGHLPRLDGRHRDGAPGRPGSGGGDPRPPHAAPRRRRGRRGGDRPARGPCRVTPRRHRRRVHHRPRGARPRRPHPQGIAGRTGDVPRWLAHLLVAVGWLLTPVLAWAASYVGLWAGALAATRFTNPLTMLGVAGAAAAVCGFTSLAIWVRFMRRVPHLLSHHMAPRASEEHRAVAAAD